MIRQLQRPCPVCEHQQGEVLHTQRFADTEGLGSPSVVDIVSCQRCGCGFSDLPTSQEDLDKSYEEHSKYADMSIFGQISDTDLMAAESPWDLQRLKVTANWLSERLANRDQRILDAGCATGTLIGLLKAHGFTNLVGLDPSPLAAATAAKHYGVDGIAGSFCSPPADIGEFDVVVLSHVLEHIADVRSAANGLASMVKTGGFVYLEVPDAVRYHEFLVAPHHDFNNEHINHFSLQCLDHLLASRGFVRVEGGSKEVPIAPTTLYPAAFGLWQKSGKTTSEVLIDADLRNALKLYVDESNTLLERIEEQLRDQVGTEAVALWGAGNLALKLLESPVLQRSNVALVVDGSQQRQGITLNGLVVTDPSELRAFEGTVVITSLHHADSIATAASQVLSKKARILRLSGAD